ncbi:MAG: DUF5752 family protein [Candidatus Bathyarchaeia archaeon]|jgi:hypothetical protein
MARSTAKKRQQDVVSRSRRALASVNKDCGFHFYNKIGNNTGVTATSIQDLANQMRTINSESVKFHFERGDFQRWIRTIFCDAELTEDLALITSYTSEETLRQEIINRIETRIDELKSITRQSA